MDRKEINAKFKELAELKIMADEISAEMEAIKDELKGYMTDNSLTEIIGDEHKVSWKEVTSNRFDSKAFKADHADMYSAYQKPSTTRRFDFN